MSVRSRTTSRTQDDFCSQSQQNKPTSRTRLNRLPQSMDRREAAQTETKKMTVSERMMKTTSSPTYHQCPARSVSPTRRLKSLESKGQAAMKMTTTKTWFIHMAMNMATTTTKSSTSLSAHDCVFSPEFTTAQKHYQRRSRPTMNLLSVLL